jgi:hypothetical protein
MLFLTGDSLRHSPEFLSDQMQHSLRHDYLFCCYDEIKRIIVMAFKFVHNFVKNQPDHNLKFAKNTHNLRQYYNKTCI